MEQGIIKISDTRSYFWLATYEWLGTAIFLFGLNYAQGESALVVSSLFIAVMITGRVGGAHFNAAVTTAVYIMEIHNWKRNVKIALVIYISDILGAYTGIAVACGIQ
jgi:hypothetical protein